MTTAQPLMIGTPLDDLAALGSMLGAEFVAVPQCPVARDLESGDSGFSAAWSAAGELEDWRREVANGPRTAAVIVAVWPDVQSPATLTGMSSSEFARRAEWPFAAWYAALGAAVARCADGGAIVAVIERPSPLDSAGWAPESGIADAVEALVRSLARSEGGRGVRANAVTTPSRLAPAHPIAPYPPLSNFPGRLDVEVRNAVEMMLGSGVAGVTGTVVHADSGRSWR